MFEMMAQNMKGNGNTTKFQDMLNIILNKIIFLLLKILKGCVHMTRW